MRGCDPADLMAFEVSVAKRGQYRASGGMGREITTQTSVGFWSWSLPSAAGDCTPFEKWLLACYSALVETKHLTRGHQMTV